VGSPVIARQAGEFVVKTLKAEAEVEGVGVLCKKLSNLRDL
jgi:hypothetical protein